MFTPSKEYLYASHTYCLQNGNDKYIIRQFKNVTCHMSHVTKKLFIFVFFSFYLYFCKLKR